MAVTTGQIIARGILHRCPNCGGRTLLRRWLWLMTYYVFVQRDLPANQSRHESAPGPPQ